MPAYYIFGSLRMLCRVTPSNANLLWERMCMDDESESQRTGRRVCRVCKQRHPADYFVDEELEKKAVDRVCKNSKRRLRLMPGDSFSYATLLSFLPSNGSLAMKTCNFGHNIITRNFQWRWIGS